jgi:DNA invertase Pin-like site-specific DNA recombinase
LQLANHHDLGRVHFVEEKISGKVSWRDRKLAEVLGSLGANDAIVVSELSRLGRSMLECMEILSVAAQKRTRVCDHCKNPSARSIALFNSWTA